MAGAPIAGETVSCGLVLEMGKGPPIESPKTLGKEFMFLKENSGCYAKNGCIILNHRGKKKTCFFTYKKESNHTMRR